MRCPVPSVTNPIACGDGCRQVTRAGSIGPDPSRSCLTSRAFWWIADGRLLRASLPSGDAVSVLGPVRGDHPLEPTGVACDGDDLAFTATMQARDGDRVDLVARLRDGAPQATVVWRDHALRAELPPPRWPALSGGLVAWSWEFTVPTLWASIDGGAARIVRADLHAGSAAVAMNGALVFPSGTRLERWSAQGGRLSRLTGTPGDQWAPAARGDVVAWLDQRDELRGTSRAPRNPQVYAMTAGGAPRRVSAAATRGWRGSPSVSERWIVWIDSRSESVPERDPDAWVRAEVWGARLPNGPERRLAPGVLASLPRVVDDALYWVAAGEGGRRDLFTRPLPRD